MKIKRERIGLSRSTFKLSAVVQRAKRALWLVTLVVSVAASFQANSSLASRPSSPESAPEVAALPGSDEHFYKLTVSQTGIQTVTYAALNAAGLPLATINPTTFQIFEQGIEIARQVVDANANGSFDDGDAILFYGRAVDTDFVGANVYWLTHGYAPGLTMTDRPAAPDSGLPSVETFRETLHLEQNTSWSKGLPKTGPADRWYWAFYLAMCSGSTPIPVWSTTVNTPHVAPGAQTGVLTPRLRGFNEIPSHTAIFNLNGTQIGQAQFTYQNEFTGSFSFSQTLLAQGANTITLTGSCPLSTTDMGAVNWLKLTYSRTYAAPATGQFPFAVDASQPSNVTLTGLPDTTAQVYDITDPLRPVLLTGGQVTGADLAFAHTLTAPARYIAAAPGQYLAPASIVPDTPSHLRNPAAGADWIIISHHTFISEAERLAAHRRLYQRYRTAVVDVQDVYDEFNGGLMDQEAIRTFLRHAYETWPRPAPRFVVLLGDGHYDPRRRIANNNAPYFIPPYLAPTDPFEGLAAADNRYVAYDPPPGRVNPLPFMHLGRLPANSLADATAMVDKIIAYETAPAHADWNATVLFVADNADAGGYFPDSSNLVATDPYYLPGYALTTASSPISLTLAMTATVTINFGFQQPPAAAFRETSNIQQPAASNQYPTSSPNTIQGRVWEDLDGDGNITAGEGPLPGIDVCVYRDPNFNGKIDATDPLVSCTVSDGNGDYLFQTLADDHYLLTVNELDRDLPSFFQRRSLYCGRTDPNQINTFFCTQDGGTTRINAAASSTALLNLLNNGALIVNYHGHASVDKWADEFLLRTANLPALTNAGRYPIMLPMTCLEGQYIDLNVSSLGESIVRLPNAGAVASWSPTGKGTSNGHELIWTAFYEAIFENGERLIGPATTYGKTALYNSDRIFKDLVDNYILFGDPAMPLDLPAADLWVQKQALPGGAAWLPGQAITYTLTYGNAGMVTAAGVRITDTLPADIVNRAWTSSDGRVTPLAGPDYAWSLPDLAPGAGGVITVTGVYSPSQPAFGELVNTAAITSAAWERPAHLTNNTAEVSSSTAAQRATIGGYLYLELTNNATYDPGADQPIPGLTVTITEIASGTVVMATSNAGGFWSVELPPGIYTVTAPPPPAGLALNTPSPLEVNATGGSVTTVNFGYVAPTGLGVEDQHAVWQPGAVRVQWRTSEESAVQEFNIYRSADEFTYGSKINPAPILPKALPGEGADYDYVDYSVTPGRTMHYWLQVISLGDGSVLWYRIPFRSSPSKTFLPIVQKNLAR